MAKNNSNKNSNDWKDQQKAYDRGESTDTSWRSAQANEQRSSGRSGNHRDEGVEAMRGLNGTSGPEWDDYAFTSDDL